MIKIIFMLLSFQTVHARGFNKVEIPNAFCGNGDPYSVFVDQQDSQKLAVEFMGGGACWSQESCHELPEKRTTLSPAFWPTPSKLQHRYLGKSPLKNHSYVYFPYCTGDVYAGAHSSDYNVHHFGYHNVLTAINYLNSSQLINFSGLKEFNLFGSSAGAIGALLHAKSFETVLPKNIKKSLIADSPGLHFGSTFWDKFTPQLISDFYNTFKLAGIDLDARTGNVAQQFTKYCSTHRDWNIGFLQASRDIVMSSIFGETSPRQHEALVYGPYGLPHSIRNSLNCRAWIPNSYLHAFLILPNFIVYDGLSAIRFSSAVMQ